MTKEQIKAKIAYWEDKLRSAKTESAHRFSENVGWGCGMRRAHIPTYDSRERHCKERIEYYNDCLKKFE